MPHFADSMGVSRCDGLRRDAMLMRVVGIMALFSAAVATLAVDWPVREAQPKPAMVALRLAKSISELKCRISLRRSTFAWFGFSFVSGHSV
jgi:hypothetical protein